MTTQRAAGLVKNWRVEGDGKQYKIVYWCKLCGASPLPSKRTSYCSDACRDEYQIRNFPAVAREQVFKRDKGVCALCGLDTEKLADEWRRRELDLRERAGENVGRRRFKSMPGAVISTLEDFEEWRALERDRLMYLGRTRAGKPNHYRWTLWDMDHIVPVADGGGQCGLENLRTLCVPCHRSVTREWRRQKAKQQRKRQRHVA